MRRINPKFGRVAVSMLIALGFVIVFLGVNKSVTGKDAQKTPDEIESVQPVRNAQQVQQQESIVVDLIEGYTGTITINTVPIATTNLSDISSDGVEPGAQVPLPKTTIFEPGNFTLTFTPSKGAAIEDYLTGVNVAVVTYWKITEGPNFAKSFTWQFDVI
ncbi:MAG: hypothetical protein ABIR32_20755 [Ilumatobacteraceae bacterium]